jgi:bacillithiol system protein YtxJ
MLTVTKLDAMTDLEPIVTADGPTLVFKHSTTCPISARAHSEWTAFLATPAATKIGHAIVRVIEERPVSLAFADQVGVAHQSPQAILLNHGKAVWNASHGSITVDSLTKAVEGL